MDPDVALRNIRYLYRRMLSDADDPKRWELLGEELAEAVQALDEWLSKGGFIPGAWCERVKVGEED